MEGSYSSFPANYVTLKDLQERWIKRKQEEEEEKLLKLRQEEEEEKLPKLRLDEENKLRKLRQEDESKRRKEKVEANPAPKSKIPNRFARKSSHSTATSATHHQTREKKAESIENKPEAGIKVKGSEAFGAKSKESPAISGWRKTKNRRPASRPIPAKESQMAVEIADKKAEKLEKGLEISRKEPTAEIIKRVANIRVAGADKGRRGMISSSTGRKGRIPSPGSGMVWVRKTTEA